MSKPYFIWYRSILKDGTLWCESSDPEEVVRMSESKDVLFQKLEYYLTEKGWENWSP